MIMRLNPCKWNLNEDLVRQGIIPELGLNPCKWNLNY